MLASAIGLTSAASWPDVAHERIPRWLQLFLLANVIEDAATGLSGLLLGDQILAPFQLTPLNGRFIGALYLAGGVGILLGALSPRLRDASPILVGFLLIAVLVEALTLIYWSDFTRDGIPIVWLITYTVDPLVLAFALLSLRLWHTEEKQRSPALPFLQALAAVFAATGIALLIARSGIVALWPWKLPPLVARVYASFFLALAAGALTAARQAGRAAARSILAATLTLPLLAILGSLLHLSRLEDGGPTVVWFAGATLVALISATALVRLSRQPTLPIGNPAARSPETRRRTDNTGLSG